MNIEDLISKLSDCHGQLKEIENGLDSFINENSDFVKYVANNWSKLVTPGFWVKLLKIRQKQAARRKLVAKYLRALLSPNCNFAMDVETVKTWRDNAQSVFITFDDTEIRHFYNTIIALKHDPDFLDPLRQKNEFLFLYFLSKVDFIEKNRDLFDGRPVEGPFKYPLLTTLFSADQNLIQESLSKAALLGEQ